MNAIETQEHKDLREAAAAPVADAATETATETVREAAHAQEDTAS
ncbi:hypothetical protein [Streptomyces pristinaespiralis]